MLDLKFAKRLAQACDDSPRVPELGAGRLVFLAAKLDCSEEAIRRYFNGTSRPRARAMQKLAKLIDRSEAWLSLGVSDNLTPVVRDLFAQASEGVQHLALGFAMLDGGHCAPPDEEDPRKSYVDFYLNYQGHNVPVKALFGREEQPGEFTFHVPREYEAVRAVGFVRRYSQVHMLDLQNELITKHVSQKDDVLALKLRRVEAAYMSGRDRWPALKSLTELAR